MNAFATRLMVTLGALAYATHSYACADRNGAVAAIENSDFETAIALQETISIDPACNDDLRLWLDEQLARHFFGRATEIDDASDKRALLETSLGYFPHWRTYAALAAVANTEGDRTREAELLQSGINQMNDGPAHHQFSRDDAQQMIDRAAKAMLLADTVVEAAPTRSGAPGGIFIENVRGYQVEEIELAIEFEFDKAVMTEKGMGYAIQLRTYLEKRNPEKIVLEGHTDPKGSAAYNMDLSLRRAKSLRVFLEASKYKGDIEVVGRGETDVPPPTQGMQADSPDHHQIARRVTLIRG